MASFLESLKSQPSRSVWARYRADRLLVLSKESGELHTLSSEFEATGTNCELPLRLATSEILALAAQGSALDWIPS